MPWPSASWPGVVPAIHAFRVSNVPPIPWMPATGAGMTGGACSSAPRPKPDSSGSSPRMTVFCNALVPRNSFRVRLSGVRAAGIARRRGEPLQRRRQLDDASDHEQRRRPQGRGAYAIGKRRDRGVDGALIGRRPVLDHRGGCLGRQAPNRSARDRSARCWRGPCRSRASSRPAHAFPVHVGQASVAKPPGHE